MNFKRHYVIRLHTNGNKNAEIGIFSTWYMLKNRITLRAFLKIKDGETWKFETESELKKGSITAYRTKSDAINSINQEGVTTKNKTNEFIEVKGLQL